MLHALFPRASRPMGCDALLATTVRCALAAPSSFVFPLRLGGQWAARPRLQLCAVPCCAVRFPFEVGWSMDRPTSLANNCALCLAAPCFVSCSNLTTVMRLTTATTFYCNVALVNFYARRVMMAFTGVGGWASQW